MSHESPGSKQVALTPLPTDLLHLVQRAYALWNRSGPTAMARNVWHPEIVWHDPPESPDAGVFHGAEAVARHLGERRQAVGRSVAEVKNAWSVDESEDVLLELSLHSKGQSSGVPLDVSLFHVIRLDEGRVIETREYLRREEALAALRPAPD
jgi:ketosteroid isomerase-like protein